MTLKLTAPDGTVLYDGPGDTQDPAMIAVMRQYEPEDVAIAIDGRTATPEQVKLALFASVVISALAELIASETARQSGQFTQPGTGLVN